MKLFYVGAGPSPRLLVRSGDRPNHLAEDWNGFVIRRRRACLGMPTDGGRWYECVELTKRVFFYFKIITVQNHTSLCNASLLTL